MKTIQALEIARDCAKRAGVSSDDTEFQPPPWVIDAIQVGAREGASNNFDRTRAWLAACGKLPTLADGAANDAGLSVQIGCHLEEFAEFLDTLNIESPTGASSDANQEMSSIVKAIAHNAKRGTITIRIYDREAALDALVDTDVTGNGVAYMAGFDKPAADDRVLQANDNKLNADGTPVILDGGKIGKRPGWVAPDLSDLV